MQTKKAILAAVSCLFAGACLAWYFQPAAVVSPQRTPMQNEILRYSDQMRPMQALLNTLEKQWSVAHNTTDPSETQSLLKEKALPAMQVLVSQMESVTIQEKEIRKVHESLTGPLKTFVGAVRRMADSPSETFMERHKEASEPLADFLTAQKNYRDELIRLYHMNQIIAGSSGEIPSETSAPASGKPARGDVK